MTETFKTVPLPDLGGVPNYVREVLEHLPPLNVYKMFAHLPSSLPPFVELCKSFFNDADVDVRLLEIAILRVAYLNKCDYQWHQHEEISTSIGLDKKEITLIRTQAEVKSLCPAENFICALADELTLHANLSDKRFEELFAHYSTKQGIGLILCISVYNMVSRFLNATRVQIEKSNPLEGKASPLTN